MPLIWTGEQGSPEWFEVRRGVATCSRLSDVMARQQKPDVPGMRTKYLWQLAGEIITETVDPDRYKNASMERGQKLEPEALEAYEFAADIKIEPVGFILNEEARFGYSPDGLVRDRGLVEIKTKQRDLHVECLLSGKAPPQHLKQCQGGMWVACRDWVDLVIYSGPKMPLFKATIVRDDHMISAIKEGVAHFNHDLDNMVARLRDRRGF